MIKKIVGMMVLATSLIFTTTAVYSKNVSSKSINNNQITMSLPDNRVLDLVNNKKWTTGNILHRNITWRVGPQQTQVTVKKFDLTLNDVRWSSDTMSGHTHTVTYKFKFVLDVTVVDSNGIQWTFRYYPAPPSPDPRINTFVAIYKFNTSARTWLLTNIDGTAATHANRGYFGNATIVFFDLYNMISPNHLNVRIRPGTTSSTTSHIMTRVN